MFDLQEVTQTIKVPKNAKNIDIIYDLIKPYVRARVHREEGELVYSLQEPQLSKKLEDVFERVYEGLLQLIDLSPTEVRSKKELINYLEEKIKFLLDEYGHELSKKEYETLMYNIYRNFVGLNEIEPLMHDDYIEDINCNGVNTEIYIKHRLFGNMKTNVSYNNEEKLKNFVIKLAQRCNKYITYSNPFLEGSLDDGSRIEGTISKEISPRGPNFSIRKFRRIPFSPTELIQSETVSASALAYLWYLIEHQSNILLIGGAGVGKTTFLNAISTFIPRDAKIVSIEDTREIRLYHENWIATVSRDPIGGIKIGEVDLDKLLRESFRENPDYVLVGEVRGKETYVMFQGMASGHPTMSTFHSEDLNSVVSRLKTPPISLPGSLIELLDIVITISKVETKDKILRKIIRVEELTKISEVGEKIETNAIIKYNFSKNTFDYNPKSRIIEKMSKLLGVSIGNIESELKKREKFLIELTKKEIFDMGQFQKEIEIYMSKK